MVQFHPRSLNRIWSVSVSAARVHGKDEGPTSHPWLVGARSIPGRTFNRARSPVATERRAKATKKERACMPLGATDPCKVGVLGSTPIRSTE